VRGLYAIVDCGALRARNIPLLAFAEAVLAARPAAIQLRAKGCGARETLNWLRALCELAGAAGVPCFANDRPDLARAAGCDGVHLGQNDVPTEVARRAGVHRIGLSTHDEAQLDAALDDDLAYVAIGPVLHTNTKENLDPVLGLPRLRKLAERARERMPSPPIVAIGGIGMEQAEEVLRVVDAVAMVGALMPEGASARELSAVTERARFIQSLAGSGA